MDSGKIADKSHEKEYNNTIRFDLFFYFLILLFESSSW